MCITTLYIEVLRLDFHIGLDKLVTTLLKSVDLYVGNDAVGVSRLDYVSSS